MSAQKPVAGGRAMAVLSPVLATDVIDVEATLAAARRPGWSVSNCFIDQGPASIEDEADIAACLPGLLATGERLVRDGFEAIVINCMCDPGVVELRERYAVPIFGPAETSMHAVAMAGKRFSVLDVVSGGRDFVERQVARYHLGSNYVSHRAIDVPVLELMRDPERTLQALEVQALLAIQDGADTVILGCTGLAELAAGLRVRLGARGMKAEIIEPLRATLAIAQCLLELDTGLARSPLKS